MFCNEASLPHINENYIANVTKVYEKTVTKILNHKEFLNLQLLRTFF